MGDKLEGGIRSKKWVTSFMGKNHIMRNHVKEIMLAIGKGIVLYFSYVKKNESWPFELVLYCKYGSEISSLGAAD